MKILLTIVVVQSFNLAIFAWFNRAARVRILALRQQLAVYKCVHRTQLATYSRVDLDTGSGKEMMLLPTP
jgi:hypothetical protein